MSSAPLAFDFLDVPLRPGKPRKSGLTIVRDRMRGLGEQREFLETYAGFVDFVKISNMAPRLYPLAFLREKLALYSDHGVVPFFGGILFENAYVQGKVTRLFDYLLEIGAPALEISDNIIAIDEAEIGAHIREASERDLTVFVEWGEKYPTALFDLVRARTEILGRLEAGAAFAILERAELDQVFDAADPAPGIAQLQALTAAVGPEQLVFEVETRRQMVGVLEAIGLDANLGPNIDFEEVKWLEPSRLGISREMGHQTIEKTTGVGGVRSSRK